MVHPGRVQYRPGRVGDSQQREPFVFSSAFEAIYQRALKGRLSADAIAKLRALGLDVERPALPAYPYAAWIQSLEVAARDVWPNLSQRDAYLELGKAMITSYQETLIGKALFAALRVFPARKVIARMTRNFRTANNYTEVVEREISPKEVELTFNMIEPTAGLTQGILAAGLPAAGLARWKVTLLGIRGDTATFRLAED